MGVWIYQCSVSTDGYCVDDSGGSVSVMDKPTSTHAAFDWEDDLEICWTVLYWFTFAMCWFIIPTVMEIYNAAEFTVWGRVKYSICAQVKFFARGVLGAIVFGILIAQDPDEQVQEKLLSALMSLGNAYGGLIMVVLLLGDGLARIPRDLWRASSAKIEEGRLCSKAGDAHTKLVGDEQAEKLKEVLRRVQDAKSSNQVRSESVEFEFHTFHITQRISPFSTDLSREKYHCSLICISQRDPVKKCTFY